jgi:hypothetical protein
MVGTGKCTIGQILKQPVVSFPLPGNNTFKLGTRWDIRNIDGDGTVVRRSASLDDGRLAPNVSFFYRNLDHNGIGTDNSVLSDAISFLQGSTPPRGTIGSPEAKTCTQLIVESPMELQITDSKHRRLGSLGGPTDYREQPTNEFMRLDDTKNATIYGGDTYRADLQGTADGEASIKMRVVGVDKTLKVMAFNHVPVTAKTKAFFTVNTTGSASSSISALTLDPDGTGLHTQTIAPVEITTNADDDVPPTITGLSPRPGQAVVGKFAVDWTATKTAGLPVSQTFGVIDAGGSFAQKVSRPGLVSVWAPGQDIGRGNVSRTAEEISGIHTLDLYAEDALENSALVHTTFVAHSFAWTPPISASGITVHGARTLPIKFSVNSAAGDFVNDASCVVTVVDSRGKAVQSRPCAVNVDGQFYYVNVNTGSLNAGTYSVRVSFDSPMLTGSFASPLIKT